MWAKRAGASVVDEEPELPKLGVAGSNPVRRSEKSPGSARLRDLGFFVVVHRLEMMHRVMQISVPRSRMRSRKKPGDSVLAPLRKWIAASAP